MALTRNKLREMGLEEELLDRVIEAHSQSLAGLKDERDEAAAELKNVKKELDELKKAAEKDPYKGKYEALQAEFDKYKNEVSAKETRAAKEKAFRELLAEAKIKSHHDSIVRATDLDLIELDENGRIKDKEKQKESVVREWAEFVEHVGEKGVETPNPPPNNQPAAFENMSLAEKMEYANANPAAAEVRSWLNR